jgi:hypothetical protein
MAKVVAEEERDKAVEAAFCSFLDAPADKRNDYSEFKRRVASKIEQPSKHTVVVKLGDEEEHKIKAVPHGNNTSAISQLVLHNVCKTLIGISEKGERKRKSKWGGRVMKV